MKRRRVSKLAVSAGLLFAGNGLLLLFTPGRFAALRTMRWMPRQYNTAVRKLASRTGLARASGALAALVGTALIVFGARQSEPVT